MSLLFTPITIGPIEVRNRAWLSPMCEYSCNELDGMPNDWHREHLTSFARGGVGMAMTEAAAISADGRISPQDVGIWTDEQAEAWAPIVERIRAHGATPAMQLAHAGRKASTYRPWSGSGSVPASEGGWQTIGPTDAPFGGFAAPRAMADDDIERVIADFGSAAARAAGAGFEILEVHAAHGYLLHQFLSPITNIRDDRWGDRTLLLRRVVEAVASNAPAAGIMVRFSAHDWVPGGVDAEMTIEHAKAALAAGAHAFDISSGGLDPRQQIDVGPGYQVPLARTVRAAIDAPVSAVGIITEPRQAEQVLADGSADAVMLGRELLRNPHWPLTAEAELDGIPSDSVWPPQYTRARRHR